MSTKTIGKIILFLTLTHPNCFATSHTRKRYRENPIVKSMLAMDLKGKYGSYQMKYQCGGCRGENYQVTRELRSPHFNCEEIIIMGFELTKNPVEIKNILVDKNNSFIKYL